MREQARKKGSDLKGISNIGSNRLGDKSNTAERRMACSFVAWKTSRMKDVVTKSPGRSGPDS